MKKVKEKHIIILVVIRVLVLIMLIMLNTQFDFLNEFESLKREAMNSPTISSEITITYRFEDKIDSLIDKGNFLKANLLLDSLLSYRENDAESWYYRKGKIYYLNKNYDLSIDFFSKAIAENPRALMKAYLWRSYAYAKNHQCQLAFKDIDIITEINSKYEVYRSDIEEICTDSN